MKAEAPSDTTTRETQLWRWRFGARTSEKHAHRPQNCRRAGNRTIDSTTCGSNVDPAAEDDGRALSRSRRDAYRSRVGTPTGLQLNDASFNRLRVLAISDGLERLSKRLDSAP